MEEAAVSSIKSKEKRPASLQPPKFGRSAAPLVFTAAFASGSYGEKEVIFIPHITDLHSALEEQPFDTLHPQLSRSPTYFHKPNTPLRSCLDLFNFLRQNPVNKPDLVAHLTLIRRLYNVRKFTDIQFVLNCIANDVNLRTQFPI
ncbi:hypothetical protein EZV62_006543 [Acer yangbiense]|uniref:Uncharacterized protein n=1 Tax=Acer yangbiense TaxID=1000413 RepID=A0A5C7I876_9ROSI|nr:hypothetical protein EZV62_006543 [Acer yangbiense]